MVNRLFITGLFVWITCAAPAQGWKDYYDSALLNWNSDWKKTIVLLQQAKQLASLEATLPDDDHLNLLYDLGIAYWNQGDHANAALYCNQSRKIEPVFHHHHHADDVFSTLTGLANLYAQQGVIEKAKAFYSSILLSDHAPSDPVTYYAAAQHYISLYENTNAPDSALKLWSHLTVLHPLQEDHNVALNTAWYLTSIRLNRKLNQYTIAEQKLSDLKKFIQQHDSSASSTIPYVDLLIEAGSLYLETERPSVAKKSLRKAKHLIGKSRSPYSRTTENRHRLAVIFELQKNYKKALRCHQQLANRINPAAPCNLPCLTVHHKIADLYLATRKYARAVEQYEYLLTAYRHFIPEHDPRFIRVLNNLAESYSGSRQYHSAYVYLRWAGEVMDVRTVERDLAAKVLTNLAAVYAWKGDHPAAKIHRDQAASVQALVSKR